MKNRIMDCEFALSSGCRRLLVAFACLLFSFSARAGTDFEWSPLLEPGVGGQVTSLSVSPFDSNRVLAGGDLLGTALSTDGGDTWQSTFGFSGGGHTVEQYTWVSSTNVWAATGRGPYLSTDGGLNWTNKRSGFPSFTVSTGMTAPVQKILVDPNNSSRLLAFIGNFRRFNSSNGYTNLGEVWESLNGGDTWSLKSTMNANRHIDNAVYKSSVATSGDTDDDTIYATSGGAFFRSDDDGATWTQLGTGLSGGSKWWVTSSPTNKATVWVVTSSGIYKSTDSGANFSLSSTGIPSGSTFRVVEVDQVDDGVEVLYATVRISTSDRGVWRSGDGGANWVRTNYANYPSNAYVNTDPKVLTIDPSDSDNVFMGNNETIYGTTDAGANWVISSSDALGSGFFAGTGYSGLVAEDFYFNPFDTNESALAGLDSGKWFSRDDLLSWKFAAGGRNKGASTFNGTQEIAFTNTSGASQVIYLAEGQFNFGTRLIRTTNGGELWSARNLPSGTSNDIQDLYVHPTNTDTVWLVRSNNLYRSTDGGNSWTELTSGISGTIRTIAADPVAAPNTIYAGSSNGVYKATDGINFTELGFPQDGVTEITIDPVKSDRIYVINRRDSSSSQRGVYRYDGDTDTWTTIVLNATIKSINDVAIDPVDNTRVFVSSDQDPFKSNTNESGVWLQEGSDPFVQVNSGLPNLRVQSLTFKPGTSLLVASTNGRGYFVADTDDGVREFVADNDDAGVTRSTAGDGGGTVGSAGNTELKIGRPGSSSTLHSIVYPFLLPDVADVFNPANPFSEANFSVALTANGNTFGNFRADLYGIGVRSSAQVLSDDYFAGSNDTTSATKIQNNFVTWPNSSSKPDLGIKTTDASGATELVKYLNSQYANGANAGKYVFLRLSPDTSPLAFKSGSFASSENATEANRPVLTTVLGEVETLVGEDFNSTSVGSIPANWTRDTGAGSVGVVDFPSSSDRSLNVNDTKDFDNSSATRDFTATSGVITASFRWRQSDQDNWTRMQLRSGSTIAVDLRTAGGLIAINGSGGTTSLLNFLSNTWYDIEIVADTNTELFSVAINGTTLATDEPFQNSASSFDEFKVSTGTAAQTSVWIDDLLITR